MHANGYRGLLPFVEAPEGRIHAEVNRPTCRLVDQPRPFVILRRCRREPEHPAAAGETSPQSIDRKCDGRRGKAHVVSLPMRVREWTQQRLARARRSRFEWKVLRVGESWLERGHPGPRGKAPARHCVPLENGTPRINPVRLVQPERLHLRKRARLDPAASALANHRSRPWLTAGV